jgi:hypothetical protein
VGWNPGGWFFIHPEVKMQPGATVTALWRQAGKHMDLFVTGTDGAVWSIWWNDSVGWNPGGWFFIHPEVKMQPGATVTALWREAGKHMDLFVTGTDGAVWSIWWNDSVGWNPGGWGLIGDSYGVAVGQTITAVWASSTHLDLFALGKGGEVVSAWWESDIGW